MNSDSNVVFVFVTSLIILSCCSQQDKEETLSNNIGQQTIVPGEINPKLDSEFKMWWPGDDASDCIPSPCQPNPITLCELAGPSTTTIAVIEIAGAVEDVPLANDCSGVYQSHAVRAPIQVLAIAAGRELPSEMSVVFLAPYSIPEQIKQGQAMVANLRLSKGEWFVNGRSPLLATKSSGLTEEKTSDGEKIDLPSTFEELSRKAMILMLNFKANCPNTPSMGDDEYDDWVHTPIIGRTCTPCGDDCGTISSEPGECDGENPPACCTDDSISCDR